MNADDPIARDHHEDMRSELRLRLLESAIGEALSCSRVKGTKLAGDLEAIRETVGEYRAQIVRAWD